MKAMVYTAYGSPDVLELKDLEKPIPKDNEVLISVHAAALNAADKFLLRGKPFVARVDSGLLKPKNQILGADVAGRVEAVGKAVTQFQVNDEVFGDLSSCTWGGIADYVCAREDVLVQKPTTMSFEEAAALPMAAVTALQGLRDRGKIKAEQKVLINGASGGVGSFAVQIAKSFGAHVTAVCSTNKMDVVRALGADQVIDYTQADFTHAEERYDLILAANGKQSVFEYRRALKPNGVCVISGGSMTQIFQAMLLGPMVSMIGSKRILGLLAKPNTADLSFLKEFFEAGKITAVIDKRYPLDQVPEAFRYLEEGHAKGKIIIALEQNT